MVVTPYTRQCFIQTTSGTRKSGQQQINMRTPNWDSIRSALNMDPKWVKTLRAVIIAKTMNWIITRSSFIRSYFDHACIPAFSSFVGFRNIIDRPTQKAQNAFAQCSYLGACVLTLYHLCGLVQGKIGVTFELPPPLPLSVPYRNEKKAIELTKAAVSWNCSSKRLSWSAFWPVSSVPQEVRCDFPRWWQFCSLCGQHKNLFRDHPTFETIFSISKAKYFLNPAK